MAVDVEEMDRTDLTGSVKHFHQTTRCNKPLNMNLLQAHRNDCGRLHDPNLCRLPTVLFEVKTDNDYKIMLTKGCKWPR